MSGAQLDHGQSKMQKDLTFYLLLIQRGGGHKNCLRTDWRTPNKGWSHRLDWSETSKAKNELLSKSVWMLVIIVCNLVDVNNVTKADGVTTLY